MTEPSGPVLVNLGCRTNAAELAELGSLLRDVSNVVVVNSCTVTTAADRDTRRAVNRARRAHAGAAIVLAGCYVDAHPGDDLGADLAIPNSMKALAQVGAAQHRVEPPGEHRSRYVLKVQEGCDNRCTFCIVWQTRGRSLSRTFEHVRRQARAAAAAGYREIVLTGIDLGSYRGGLAELVAPLLEAAAPARLRLSSIDPSHVDIDLCRLFDDPRLCPHLHLPLQSGSDAVLARMRRRYDVAHFERVVVMARRVRPDLALTGDLMVAFPGEGEDDFERTLAVVERAAFMDLHVFRFSPRPRTAAGRYREQVPPDIGRRRSRELIELGHRLRREYERSWEGRQVTVIWDRAANGMIKGISENYLQVTAPAQGRRAGMLEEITWTTASSAA